jgi:hypothetical protein
MQGRGQTRRGLRVLALAALVAAPLSVAVAGAGPAGATSVGDEASFRTAWANDTAVDLTADITLACTGGGGAGVATRDTVDPVVVNGNGHTITQTCRTGTDNGVLRSSGSGDVTLKNITITGGQTSDTGGGVNLPSDFATNLTVDHSTIAGNVSCNQGGGLYSDNSGSLTVRSSTLTGNVSQTSWGGGIDDDSGALLVVNSTLTGNRASSGGGAIDQDGTGTTLVYSTIVANAVDKTLSCFAPVAAATASNPHHHVGPQAADDIGQVCICTALHAFGTVITDPIGVGTTGSPAASNCNTDGTTYDSSGFNFSDDTSCGFTQPTDKQGAGNNPMLGSLANNGGPTQTMLPQTGSPLIDAIALADCGAQMGIGTDQRDVGRPQGPGCDIGAVEVVPVAVVVTPKFTG